MIVREAYRDRTHRCCYAHWHGELPLPATAPSLGPVQDARDSFGCEFCEAGADPCPAPAFDPGLDDGDDGYTIIETASGHAVRRTDGAYAEFLGGFGLSAEAEATEALILLRSDAASEADYAWEADRDRQ